MAQAHAKPNHDYQLVDPSPWPIIGAAAAFVLAAGAILWMKHISFGGLKPGSYVFGAGLLGVLYVMFSWWSDVIKEAEHGGFHTLIHRRDLAAQGHRGTRPVALPAPQHAHSSDLWHDGDLGPSCPPAR
jgi:hypothetical protein